MRWGKVFGIFLLLCVGLFGAVARPVIAGNADSATKMDTDKIHILAFGDSLTQGYGLLDGEGFVPQMAKWVGEHRDEHGDEHGGKNAVDVVIINGGVSGDTTAGGAARFGWSLNPEIQGVILALGGNDMLRGLDPVAARANLITILDEARAANLEVLLIGVRAPGNFGIAYKETFDAVYPELSKTYETLYFDNFFKGLGGDPQEALEWMQADGIHPNPAGVIRIVDAMGPAVLGLIAKIKVRE